MAPRKAARGSARELALLRAHYPTDVIGGVVVGTLGAYAVRAFFATRGWLFVSRPEGLIRVRPFAATRRLVRSRKIQPK